MREKFKERRWTAALGLQTLELRLQAFSKETRTLVVLVEKLLLQDIGVWRSSLMSGVWGPMSESHFSCYV